ncbi:MAG: LacI family DNA-binding transcriptional regulator [Pseudonocardiaceae bacterium]|nr:LacI family DNA-binding transcriptional regulator [Pseudonocardiaceae bacterium]
MADVAARVGVSRALVSLVFRDEPGASNQTRERVFQAAAELGYRPDSAARVLARNHSRVLGVTLTVRNPFHADLVERIYPVAEQLGYDILISATAPSRDERKSVEALMGHRCEALVLLGPDTEDAALAELGGRIPIVVVGRRIPEAGVDTVHTAEAKGVRQAMDHLAELGHRSILHIDGGNAPGAKERRGAYRAAMRKHGLSEHARVLRGDHTEESGARAARLLLAEQAELPTAILASNDRCAMGLLDALRRAGVEVPGQVSVVGYDDSHVAHFSHIDLTTVHQDSDRMAEYAVRALVNRIADPNQQPQELVLDAKLIVRGTTAPPRNQ